MFIVPIFTIGLRGTWLFRHTLFLVFVPEPICGQSSPNAVMQEPHPLDKMYPLLGSRKEVWSTMRRRYMPLSENDTTAPLCNFDSFRCSKLERKICRSRTTCSLLFSLVLVRTHLHRNPLRRFRSEGDKTPQTCVSTNLKDNSHQTVYHQSMLF